MTKLMCLVALAMFSVSPAFAQSAASAAEMPKEGDVRLHGLLVWHQQHHQVLR